MNKLIESAINNFYNNYYFKKNIDIPIIAFVVDKNFNIISIGYNNMFEKNNIYGHAEINALQKAADILKVVNLKDYILISSLEPCMMCLGAIINSNIKNIFYYLDSKKTGFLTSNHTFDISKFNIKRVNNETTKIIKTKIKYFFNKLR